MSDKHDSVAEKVSAIFRELAGDRARELEGTVVSDQTRKAISRALAQDYGVQIAADIAHHMSDWNSDAAFIVAVHLFPERFTTEEIEAGIGMFLVHAPNHIREACRLTGKYVWENFPDDEEGLEKDDP